MFYASGEYERPETSDEVLADRCAAVLISAGNDAESDELAALLHGWAQELTEIYDLLTYEKRMRAARDRDFYWVVNETDNPHYYKERDDRIIDVYEGQSLDVVAEFEGVSVSTVRRVRRNAGRDPKTGAEA